MRQIILASSSIRRKELLQSVGLKFRVKPSNIDEKLNPRLGPRAQVEYLSEQKAQVVAAQFPDAIIIGADTLVVLDNQIMGKPKSIEEGKRFLRKLSGTVHSVVTGFTLIDTSINKTITKSSETKILMKRLSVREIDEYVRREDILDKAGGYAMQGIGSVLFEKIEGDYYTVIGLPMYMLGKELKRFGVSVL